MQFVRLFMAILPFVVVLAAVLSLVWMIVRKRSHPLSDNGVRNAEVICRCNACQFVNRAEARFCARCGRAMHG